ncbi:Uncharacterised protein [Mycoplasmopsis edwardii]|uniref:Uncharacterized protein n=1 Tax=Mycoplasmopsis edwardii TaxID=53558 RepID=A0A3B0QAL7_9BACT|nr:Uncharacterised protein [Mycoplasmopsis edwardii]
MLKIIVLDAFDTSVACTLPSVNFHINHVSIVPANNLPSLSFCCASGTFLRIQRIFVALKYGLIINPVFSVIFSDHPSATRPSQ